MRAESELIVYLCVDCQTQNVINSNFKEDDGISFSSFFDKHLSADSLGEFKEGYNKELLLKFLLEKRNRELYFFSREDDNGFRFLLTNFKDKEVVCLTVEKFYGSKDELFLQTHDLLTGFLTRAFLYSEIEKILNDQSSFPVALILIDLNNFKYINDTYGHRFGDDCLRQFSALLSEVAKDNLIGRYGGDEFIIFMSHTSREKVVEMCKKIVSIELPIESKDINVTLSCCCGVASSFEYKKVFVDYLLEIADKSLYKSKRFNKKAVFLENEIITGNNQIKDEKNGKDNVSFKNKNVVLFHDELRRNKRTNIIFVLIMVIFLASMTALTSISINKKVEKETFVEASNTMTTISSQVENGVASNINSWFSQLYIADKLLSDITISDSSQNNVDHLISLISNKISFDKVGLLLESGELYFSKEYEYNISSERIAEEIIINNNQYIDKIHINFVGEIIILGIPYSNRGALVHTDSQEDRICGICGIISTQAFANFLNYNAFNGHASISIIKDDGTHVIDSNNIAEIWKDRNFFNVLRNNMSDTEYNKIYQEFQNNEMNVKEIALKDEKYFVYFTPLVIDQFDSENVKWKVVVLVPSEYVIQNIVNVFNNYRIILIIVSCFVLILSVILALVLQINNKRIKILKYVDPVTKNINLDRFYIDASKLMKIYADYAVVSINVLNFKFINDQLGKVKGNEILANIFNTISENINKDEIVSRNYADRYNLIIRCKNEEELYKRLNKIKLDIEKMIAELYQYNINVAIGAYLPNRNIDNIAQAIDKSRIALRYVQNDYLSLPIKLYKEEMLISEIKSNELEQLAELALKQKDFIVYYQAKRDIQDNRWSGAEALVRWKDSIRGIISPGDFIPLFEKNGFVVKLDLYVFEQVCKDLRYALDKKMKIVPISVNVSRRHFVKTDFMKDYGVIMQKYDIPGELIEFEITESAFEENNNEWLNELLRFKNNGCEYSIDDFGSGYSSLNMLRDLPFDIIKLDRKFLYGKNGFDEKSQIIVKEIINLANRLDKKIVAEGIETSEQVEFLKKAKCKDVQGYYFAKPVPFDSFIKVIANDKID